MNTGYQGGSPVVIFVMIIIYVIIYFFMCYCWKRICKKAGTETGILIWIPILQIFPILKAAGMPAWYFILLLIPFVNIIVSIILLINLLKKLGQNPVLVILFFIPFINIIYFLYLAFSK